MSATDKASMTDRTAKAIIAEENTQLQSKTERLRRMRLEREAVEPAPAPKRNEQSVPPPEAEHVLAMPFGPQFCGPFCVGPLVPIGRTKTQCSSVRELK
nr:hypothetical protein [Marinicella sp. W31]MDC2878699.1 hypothetical protein [Marinicella sp. W31]